MASSREVQNEVLLKLRTSLNLQLAEEVKTDRLFWTVRPSCAASSCQLKAVLAGCAMQPEGCSAEFPFLALDDNSKPSRR